jgi:beta-lactamase class A
MWMTDSEDRPERRVASLAALLRAVPLLFVAAAAACSNLSAQSTRPAAVACLVPDSVGSQLERIARRAGWDVGVTAVHIETGARISLNGDRRFPMASVSKIPMALEFLRLVDAGQIRLSDTLLVRPTEFVAGNSPLASWSGGRPVRRTVDSLFTLMLAASDNTATDVILRMSGGPEAATRRVRELGIEDVTVDRSETRTFADLSGIPSTVPESELYRYSYFRMRDALPQAHRDSARLAYGDDPRDTATPDGMARLLQEIHHGAGLSDATRRLLLDTMMKSKSGKRRLRGQLPSATPVAHKTGTMAGAINDVGIMTLPSGDHVAIAVFVNTLYRTTYRRERTIAEIGRLLYDYFGRDHSYQRLASIGAACPTTRSGL